MLPRLIGGFAGSNRFQRKLFESEPQGSFSCPVPSPPVTNILPSGLNAIPDTSRLWAVNTFGVASGFAAVRSHTRTLESFPQLQLELAVASQCPSELNATLVT